MVEQRPMDERPIARPSTPTPEPVKATPQQLKKARIIGISFAVGIVLLPILIVLAVIAGNSAKEAENEAAYARYQQTVAEQKSEASDKCFAEMANWLGTPLSNPQVMTYEVLGGTVKVQGVALGGQFTCVFTDEADVSKKKLKQLAWDKMDGSTPQFYIP